MAQLLTHNTDQRSISIQQDMIKQLSSFEESTSMLYKLSEELPKNSGEFPVKGFEYIYLSLTDKLCKNCPAFRECFGSCREETLEEIGDIFEQIGRRHCVSADMAPKSFRGRCIYFQPFMEEMQWLYKLAYQNYYWENRMQGLRLCMQGQLAAQLRLIGGLRHNMEIGRRLAGPGRLRLRMMLLCAGTLLTDGLEYRESSGFLECVLWVRALPGAGKASALCPVLSAYYHKNMKLNQEDRRLRGGINRISFVEESSFYVIFGKAASNKKGEAVNGDTFSQLGDHRQRAAMILADGMGTGEQAFAESRHTIEVLESMIASGIDEEYAVEILHQALLYQDRGRFSTLDVAVLSLQTGVLKMIKAGGCATFIRRKDQVERITAGSLPPGSYDGQQFALKYKKLYDGDMVIMVSDGVLAFEQAPDLTQNMEHILSGIHTNNAQRFAQSVIEALPDRGRFDDDKTVLVASVWEKGKRNVG